MAEYLIRGETLDAIAEAINQKRGTQNTYTPNDMVSAIAAISTRETVSWHQCPEAVRNYIAYVAEHPYSMNDGTVSYIANYAPSNPDTANTKPVPYTIEGVSYINNIPNIQTPFATASRAGTLTALDHLCWYNTRTANVRDLGGWACDGGTVKYRTLIRGGLPLAAYAAQDKELMVDIVGVKSELQLYGGSDDQYHYDEVSLWDIDWYGTNGFIWYSLSNTTVWKYNLKTVFDSVNHNKPIYFHCGAGKDRTGSLAVMLLALLGVSQSDIDQDYELTSFATGTGTGLTSRTYSEYQNYINAIHSFPLAQGLGDTLQEHAFSFALSLGFTADEINDFRANSIDGIPSIITPESMVNLADPSSAEWMKGYRINSSAQIVSMLNSQVTNLIPVATGDIIRIKNAGQVNTYIPATYTDASVTQGTKMEVSRTYDSTTGIVTMTITNAANPYARFSFLTADVVGTVNDIIITRNQEIT